MPFAAHPGQQPPAAHFPSARVVRKVAALVPDGSPFAVTYSADDLTELTSD
jgi:hypothetical protein